MADRRTVEVYDAHARRYLERRSARGTQRARTLAAATAGAPLGVRLDLGCGPGLYTPLLGEPVVALDVSGAMLDLVPDRAPHAWRVQADVEALPFRRRAVAAAWASKCHQHLPHERLPLALAELHHAVEVGALVDLTVFGGQGSFVSDDDLPGRLFSLWEPDRLVDVVVGAGFRVLDVAVGRTLRVRARRLRSLADTVGAGMRLLVCGLNPSLYAADAGVGYARPGNRFWPAAMAAGLVSRDRDARHALVAHGVGMTDLVKRATTTASELTAGEYRQGLRRVERLVAWLRPAAVCFVGMAGWRAAVDPAAQPGWQEWRLGGVPAYLMPSTSGLNARSRLEDLAGHLRAAAAGPDGG